MIEFILRLIFTFFSFILFFWITRRFFKNIKPMKIDEMFFCSLVYLLTDMILEKLKVNELSIWLFDPTITIIFFHIYKGILIPLTRSK